MNWIYPITKDPKIIVKKIFVDLITAYKFF